MTRKVPEEAIPGLMLLENVVDHMMGYAGLTAEDTARMSGKISEAFLGLEGAKLSPKEAIAESVGRLEKACVEDALIQKMVCVIALAFLSTHINSVTPPSGKES